MSEEKLPYRVLAKATEMFGGSGGFSYGEMEAFFCHALNKHPDDLGLVGGSNRPAGFNGLRKRSACLYVGINR